MSLFEKLRSPKGKASFNKVEDGNISFNDETLFPIVNNVPVLIDRQNVLFSITDIIKQVPQTQDKNYQDISNPKNFVRRRVLPSISHDYNLKDRYLKLGEKVRGGTILIVGAGNKIDFYKHIFSGSSVITSDVHLQFNPDVVFDIHEIPFGDDFFDLVLVGQVLEHAIRPWIAAIELQRITKVGGYIQVEVPFVFPYHGAPYDFFRFTFSGMRSLFMDCAVADCMVSEGVFTAAAVVNGQLLVGLSKRKLIRYILLGFSRFTLFWMKFFDRLSNGKRRDDFMMHKGHCMTFVKDNIDRNDLDCLNDFYNLK